MNLKFSFIKSHYETLQLNIKWWNLASSAWGWRLIIVDVQLGAVKIYVAAAAKLRKKERRDETQGSGAVFLVLYK